MALLAWLLLWLAPAPEADPLAELPAPTDDPLGPIVVEATPGEDDGTAPAPLLTIGVTGSDLAATKDWYQTVRRDLELFGGFRVREVTILDDGAWLAGAAVGVELEGVAAAQVPVAIVGEGEPAPDGGAVTTVPRHVVVRVYDADGKVRWQTRVADHPDDALQAHGLTDSVLEGITGYRGGFATRLAFSRPVGTTRRVYALDVDGGNVETVSGTDEVAIAPSFDGRGRLVYATSVDDGRYRIMVPHEGRASVDLGGSVYGLAYSRDGSRVAAAIARGAGIQLWVGSSDFEGMARVNDASFALHPAFGPDDRLAYVAEVRKRPRVMVGGRPVSSAKHSAAAPEFCFHPQRPRLVWAEKIGGRWVLVRADARGRDPVRISDGWGDARWPACSPDGRMIAFVSNGRGRDPGIYVTNIERFHPRKIASLTGSALQWSTWR